MEALRGGEEGLPLVLVLDGGGEVVRGHDIEVVGPVVRVRLRGHHDSHIHEVLGGDGHRGHLPHFLRDLGVESIYRRLPVLGGGEVAHPLLGVLKGNAEVVLGLGNRFGVGGELHERVLVGHECVKGAMLVTVDAHVPKVS
jgi:hypothetical protein